MKVQDAMTQHELIRLAHRNVDAHAWDYMAGGSESETTLRRNRLALDMVAFRPRVLRDVSKIDTSVTVLGQKLKLPVMIAPVGSLETFEAGGGASAAQGAGAYGAAHMLSSVCEPGLEAVAEAAPGTLRIYQLYVRGNDDWVDDRVRRAIAAGYKAFCFTVDVATYSRRERDIAKRHVPRSRRRATKEESVIQSALDWRTIERVKRKFDIPIVIKGIATAEDAEMAVARGVEVVYVSNHGGRQLDHGRGAFEVLPEVVDAVKGRAKIWFDSGVTRGTDVVKAVAMGAELVGLGRLGVIGLAAGGKDGIVRMLELMESEVVSCLGNLGVTRFADLNRSYLHYPAPATGLPGLWSQFPLLDIERTTY